MVMTDLHMPKIDGFEFIDILQNDEMYMDIPVLVMSSNPREEALSQLRKYHIEG